jgi:hypothetical protein
MGVRRIQSTRTFLRPLIIDKVRHRLLLDKMSTDVEPSRCQWLVSYFSGRIQRVRMGDCVSRDILVTSGVPQGRHLGPFCFIWFVNKISRTFRHVRVLFYADGMKLFLPVGGFRDCIILLNFCTCCVVSSLFVLTLSMTWE